MAADTFRASTFEVQVRRFRARTIDGRREIETVIGTRPGVATDQIVLLAHRDAAARGSAAELSGTAALLELAHVLAGRVTQHTVTLVSTSGGSGGDAGAVDYATHVTGGPVDAVIVLGDLASARRRPPVVVSWSERPGTGPPRLARTLDAAVSTEVGRPAGETGSGGQLLRLAVPFTYGEQGALLAHGLPAVLLQASGERGPSPGARIDQLTLQSFGRAALRAVNAIDTGPAIGYRSDRDVILGKRRFPGWAVRLLLGTLLLGPLLVAIDAFARARRRREPMGPGLRWAATEAVPFVLTAAFVAGAGRLGLLGPAPGGPALPRALPVNGLVLGAATVVFAIGWLIRPMLWRRQGIADVAATARAPATGPVVLLGMCVLALIVWVVNPYAALLVIPALHVWLIPLAPELRVRRWLALTLALAGAIPLVLVAVGYLAALGVNPLQEIWMALLAVAGGHVGPLAALMWSLLLGGGVAVLALSARRAQSAPGEPPEVTVRGPVSYAGPGSLGGTESALRR
jgi:hypothetical protein